VAPSFVEAVAGKMDPTPDPHYIAAAEEMLVRLELDGVAVRLNLQGQPSEQPDFVVAGWVLPYVYALRGDRDWRRSPQLTGSRQVSQLAVQAYKLLETSDKTISELTHTLGREVTESAVLRAITELWQQLRIIPIIQAPGKAAEWQLLRQRFQKAIAEGASTSQVTAISVLASIYLQAVIAATMEDVELFLSTLTARSKVREVLRGLVATRQVHTISMGHAPHFYVAGTLPEFAVVPQLFANSSLPGAKYFLNREEDEELEAGEALLAIAAEAAAEEIISSADFGEALDAEEPPVRPATRAATIADAAPSAKPAARPHFNRPAGHTSAHAHDRKPAQAGSGRPPARRASSDSRSAGGSRPTAGSGARWSQGGTARPSSARPSSATSGARPSGNGSAPDRGAKDFSSKGKSAAPAWKQRSGSSATGNGSTGSSSGAKSARPASKFGAATRTATRTTADGRPARPSSRPVAAGGAKRPDNKRFSHAARPSQGTNKRG